MKKYIASIITVFAICMFISGCGKSAPKGTDPQVQATVIEIAREELIRQAVYGMFRVKTMEQARELVKQDQYKKFGPILDKVENATFKVDNIRADSVDDNIKKSSNSADLLMNVEGQTTKLPITYTAQYNDNGQIYVEVFGLKK